MLSPTADAATFGANVGGLFRPGHPPTANALAELQALRATGATVARSDTFWQVAEMQPPVNGTHRYDWTYDDSVASTLALARLRWQPIIDYAAWWAANSNGGWNPGVAPGYTGDYAAYAGAFAARYGPGGRFWSDHPQLPPEPVTVFEIWNEPDLGMFWGPQPDLVEYATMFLQARATIRSVVPGAKVVIGGLVSPWQSLHALAAARPDLRGNVDGVGVHPYRGTVAELMSAVASDLKVDAATVGAPLYVNEFGWQNNPAAWQGATEAVRDSNLQQATQQLGRNPYVADVEPYCWGCANPFDLYGTPGANAFAAAIAAAQPPPPGTRTSSTSQASVTTHHQHGRHHRKKHRHRKKHHRRHSHGKHHARR
jgi:hypothetical protein